MTNFHMNHTTSIVNIVIIDSLPEREMTLRQALSDPQLKIVKFLSNTHEALSYIQNQNIDVIVLSINVKNGSHFIQQVMQKKPVPILIFKGEDEECSKENELQLISVGAIMTATLPDRLETEKGKQLTKQLRDSIKTLQGIRLITRKSSGRKTAATPHDNTASSRHTDIQAIGIGASLGGPIALSTIFSNLPADFPVPIFAVQHIAQGFIPGLISWLKATTPLPLTIAKDSEIALPGHIYFAPDDAQMCVTKGNTIRLEPKKNQEICPSVGKLFLSMAETYGKHCVAILLTGMGRDGADELLLLKNSGAVTIAQDESSCLVFGMPQSAIEIGAVNKILPLSEIAPTIKQLIESQTSWT